MQHSSGAAGAQSQEPPCPRRTTPGGLGGHSAPERDFRPEPHPGRRTPGQRAGRVGVPSSPWEDTPVLPSEQGCRHWRSGSSHLLSPKSLCTGERGGVTRCTPPPPVTPSRARRGRFCPECPLGPSRPASRPLKDPRAGQAAVHTGLAPVRSWLVTRARGAVSSAETAPHSQRTRLCLGSPGAGPRGMPSTADFHALSTVCRHAGPGQRSSFPSMHRLCPGAPWPRAAAGFPVPPAWCPPMPGVGTPPLSPQLGAHLSLWWALLP